MKNSFLFLLLAVLSVTLTSCSKKIEKDKLQFRNNLAYEVNSETPYSGRVVEYNDKEQKKIKTEEYYKDGLLDGICIAYYENGQKKTESNYANGKLYGKQTLWRENGTVSTSAMHDTTMLLTAVHQFDETGQLVKTVYDSFNPALLWKKMLSTSPFIESQFYKDFDLKDKSGQTATASLNKKQFDGKFSLPDGNNGFYSFILTDLNKPLISAIVVFPSKDGLVIMFREEIRQQIIEALSDCGYSVCMEPEAKRYILYRNENLSMEAALSKAWDSDLQLFSIHPINNNTF